MIDRSSTIGTIVSPQESGIAPDFISKKSPWVGHVLIVAETELIGLTFERAMSRYALVYRNRHEPIRVSRIDALDNAGDTSAIIVECEDAKSALDDLHALRERFAIPIALLAGAPCSPALADELSLLGVSFGKKPLLCQSLTRWLSAAWDVPVIRTGQLFTVPQGTYALDDVLEFALIQYVRRWRLTPAEARSLLDSGSSPSTSAATASINAATMRLRRNDIRRKAERAEGITFSSFPALIAWVRQQTTTQLVRLAEDAVVIRSTP